MHPTAAAGFAAAADAYERARPEYAPEAIAWLAERAAIREGTTVVDLAAGTGKLTRALVRTGATVVAVEPVAEMRAALERALPAVVALEGTAEAMPLDAGSADVVAVGQAFHWFDLRPALAEIARVLRTGGWLAVVWNMRDLSHPLQRAVDDLLAPVREATPRARGGGWRDALAATPLFGDGVRHEAPNPVVLTRALLRDRIASASFVATLPREEREELLARAAALVDGDEPFAFPYVTEAYLFPRSRDRAG